MNKTVLAICAMGIAAVFAGAPANAAEPADFVKTAIRGNIAEVQMGELAQKQAQNPQVKDFGKTLANDHSKAREQAVALAKEMDIDPPATPPENATESLDRLADMSGAEFDKAFVELAVKEHKKDIETYREQIDSGQNQKVVSYARETLPVLQKHLETAQKLQDKVSN